MIDLTEQQITRRFDQLVSLRKTLDQTYQYIERFIRPFSGEFFKPESSEHEVLWRRRQIYDATAPNAVNLLAAQLHGNLTSPATRWFDLAFRDKKLKDNKDAVEWLEECTERVYQALLESDFNLEASKTYLDLVSYGTAVIAEEEENAIEWKGVDFTSFPVRAFAIVDR